LLQAKDRLILPEDACLETVKMYQKQLHLLLSYKNYGREMQIGSTICSSSLQSLCQSSNNSSPASLGSNSANSDTKRNGTTGSRDSKSPSRNNVNKESSSKSPKLFSKSSSSQDKNKNPTAKGTLISNTKAKVLQASQSVSMNRKSPGKLNKLDNKKALSSINNTINNKLSSPNKNDNKKLPSHQMTVTNNLASTFNNKTASKIQNSITAEKLGESLKKTLNTGKVQQAAVAVSPVNNSSSSSQSASTVSDVSGAGSGSTPTSILGAATGGASSSSAGSSTVSVHHSTGATNKKIPPYKVIF